MNDDMDGPMDGYTVPPVAVMQKADVILSNHPDDLTDFDEILRFTQQQRIEVIKAVKKQMEAVVDPALMSVALKALGDMDKGVVSKRRLGIEEVAQKSNDEQLRNVSELLRGIKVNMFHAKDITPRTPPKLGDSIASPHLVPGETEQGVANLNYASFISGLPAITEES